MNTANRRGLLGALITLGVVLALAAVVTISNTPVHANSDPDLEVETPSVADTSFIPVADASFYPGDRITLHVTVTNVGGGDAESTPLRYYRSADSTITSSDTEQGVTGVSALAAAGTSIYYVFLTVPSQAGTYYYGACVDSVTGESDTTNNCSSVMVTVLESEPDLVLANPGASDRIETGGSFRLGVSVINQGDPQSQSAATTLRWKSSTDATITTSDTSIGTKTVPALRHQASAVRTIELTAPSTPGTYYYGACVDSVEGESDTTNNCSSSVTVTLTNNLLATGAPTITGTAQVGETLTADTSGIADADGLDNVTYSYQWLADDAEIDGATSSTYTLQASDEGKVIKVRVTFTDDAGNDETLTSAATSSVAALPIPGSAPDIPAQPVGTAIFVGGVDLEWNDVPGADSYDVQLFRNGQWMDLPGDGVEIAFYGAGAIISELDPGSSHWFQVRSGNAHGSSDWSNYRQVGSTNQTTSGKRARPDNVLASGAPVITGTAQVGESLTADAAGIEDGNGLDRVQFRFQWVINDGSADAEITGATGSSYTLVGADEGKTVKVRVSFTDRVGYAESLTSAATETVSFAVQQQVANNPATGAPTINGTAQVGETLTADTSGIADADSLANVSYSYQWVRNDGTSDTDITGATDSTYTLVADDEGKTIRVRVSFTDDADNDESLTSAATATVGAGSNSPATGAPTITGIVQVGETLTADTSAIADADGLANVSHSYQWVANDGTSDTDITDAIASSYTLVAADEGKTIKVGVSFTDDESNEESLTSEATEAVAAAPPSYITVVVTEDDSDLNNIVTNFTITWSDADACSTNYNAYLNIRPSTQPGHATPGSQLHLGSAASDGAQITKVLTGVLGGVEGFDVELYCGTDGSGRLVSEVEVFSWDYSGDLEDFITGRPLPNTYSSEPSLSALSVSHGTLTPTFKNYTSSYAVPDVDNADTWITITATPKTGYAVDFFEASDDGVFGVGIYSFAPWGPPSGLSADCGRSYSDSLGPLIQLTDADPNTPGFQVDLYDGDNYVHMVVYPTAYCNLGSGYHLAITRAEGSVSSPRPNSPARGGISIGPAYAHGPCVGCTLDADASRISDRDGWDESTFSYQWLADDVEISGATGTSYTVTSAELGKTLKLRVSFTDDRGTAESVNSGATSVVKLSNSDPIGKPVILGTLEVGQTLSADVSGVSDPNGMTNATLSYEWVNFHGTVRDGEEYTLVDRDEGDCGCWLWVIYTDDDGHEERVSSGPIGVVAARSDSRATGVPAITGTAEVGETLTADTSGIVDADGLANATFLYQWLADDVEITGATGSTYVLTSSEMGKAIKVQVSFTDDGGNNEVLTSAATGAVSPAVQQQQSNAPATGEPTINGTAQVGETLTADTSGMADADGLTSVSYSYQWVRSAGTNDVDITGAAASTYTLVDADEGKTVKVKVSFTDDADNDETLTSAATAEVVAAAPTDPPGRPRNLTGTANSDGTVTLSWGAPSDDSVTGYQILRRRPTEGENTLLVHVNDTGSTATQYTDNDVTPDVRHAYRVKAINAVGLSRRSNFVNVTPAQPAAPAQNSPATGTPTISGTAQVGETLTADTSGIADADGLANVSFSYQWIANDGSTDTDIQDSTGSSYTLMDADQGKTIKVKVSFTDAAGNAESLSSTATASALARPNTPATGAPTISGTAQVGEALTADTSGIADADGLSGATFSYQWVANDGTSDTDITGATGSTYTLAADDEGKTIKVRVSFTDDAGHGETLTSTATAAVAAAPNSPATGAPSISGTAQVGETLMSDTSGIADADGLTNVSFSYQWVRNDGNADTDIQDATGASYALVDADEGKSIKVKVSFTDDAGNEETLTSAATSEVAAAPSLLTVSLESSPASHNGTDVFTFQIRFSEEFKLSFRTLRDHAFAVDGGVVTKATRQVKGSNLGWTITVEPDSNGAVGIVLPATTDCDATGAICTEDGRKLDNPLDFTVSGPN